MTSILSKIKSIFVNYCNDISLDFKAGRNWIRLDKSYRIFILKNDFCISGVGELPAYLLDRLQFKLEFMKVYDKILKSSCILSKTNIYWIITRENDSTISIILKPKKYLHAQTAWSFHSRY